MPFNYSHTKCSKCGHTSFELVEDAPTKSSYKMWYLRCSSCNTFLQALDYYNVNAQLGEIKKKLGI